MHIQYLTLFVIQLIYLFANPSATHLRILSVPVQPLENSMRKFKRRRHRNLIIIQNRMKYQQISLIFLVVLTILANDNPCPENCEQCDEFGSVCFLCSGDYDTNVMGGCSPPTIQNCITYGPNEQCFRCRPSFSLTPQGKCLKSYTGCINEAGIDQCFECGFGLTAQEGHCKGIINCEKYEGENCILCKPGYALADNVCTDSSQNCLSVRPDGICNQCKQGFIQSGYQCFHQSLKNSRCYVLAREGNCAFCKVGYNNINGQCLKNSQSPSGNLEGMDSAEGKNNRFEQAKQNIQNQNSEHHENIHENIQNINQFSNQHVNIQKIQIPNCQLIDQQNSQCLVCEERYHLKDGHCSKVSQLCNQYNPQNGDCFECRFGLPIISGKCVDAHCQESKQWKCVSCFSGFRPDQNGICQKYDPNCARLQNRICIQCIADFQIVNPGGPCTKMLVIENCETIDRRNARCAKCANRYFTDGNKCSKVSDLCRDYNQQDGKCANCISNGFRVDNGRCIDPNCARPNGDNCASCIPNFVYNDRQRICRLTDPNCQNLAISQCLDCRPGFYVGTQKMCRTLPANCLKANPNGACSICAQGFQLNGAACIRTIVIANCAVVDHLNNRCTTCNNRFYSSGSSCLAVPESCNDYDQNGKCTSCVSNLILQNGACIAFVQATAKPQTSINGGIKTVGTVKGSDLNCRQYSGARCSKCSSRYYVGPTNRCVPVNPLCKDHNSAGECTACYNGYVVSSGKCIVAQALDPNCKSQSASGCNQCYKGFYFNVKDKICKKLNPLCRSSNIQTGACTDCYPGYMLNPEGNCQIHIKDPNCKDYNKDSSCKVCASKYFIGNNGKCSPANPLCKEFNQSNGLCTACFPGYGLNPKGQCIRGYSSDPNCKQFQGASCRECVTGFYLGRDGKCKQASPLCKTFDRDNGNCLTCYTGYEVSDDTCIVSKTADPFCRRVESGRCTACFQGYISIKGKCIQQNPLCKTIDKDTGACTSCWPGYSLEDENCEQDTTASAASNDPFCVKITDGVCSQCSNGYYFNRNQEKCTQADPQCKTHDDDNGGCTSCYTGYTLTNGKCLVAKALQILNCHQVGRNGNCLECNQGTYLINNECKQVSILCGSYNKANGECTSCVTGHFLQDGTCIFPALYDQNCVRYESAYCSKCLEGFYLSNYICMEIDPNCAKFNQLTQSCEVCANNLYPNGSVCQ